MNMSCSKSALALGFSVGVLLLSSACGNSPKTANVAGSWFWAENNLTVSPPVITKLHANLSQTGVTVTGSKIVPGGSCAITATIKGGQLQGTIGAPCDQTFAVNASNKDTLAGRISDGIAPTQTVYATRDHT